MVQIKILSKNIEEQLNGNIHTKAQNIKFKIHSEVGNYKKAEKNLVTGKSQSFINGILSPTTGDIVPVQGLNNYFTSLMLEFIVTQNQLEQAELVLTNWIESTIGQVIEIDKFNAIITPKVPNVGYARTDTPLGTAVPLMVILEIQFIKDGLISNLVDWKINNKTVLVSEATIESKRIPDMHGITNQNITKGINQTDSLAIVLRLPYSFKQINIDLLNDILKSKKDQIYTVSYSDNFTDIFEMKCIIVSATLSLESGKIATLLVSFAPANLDLLED